MTEMKKCVLSFADDELVYLGGLLNAFSDYMAGDDRPDHGMARLEWYRKFCPEQMKSVIYRVAGKIEHHHISCRRKKVGA